MTHLMAHFSGTFSAVAGIAIAFGNIWIAAFALLLAGALMFGALVIDSRRKA